MAETYEIDIETTKERVEPEDLAERLSALFTRANDLADELSRRPNLGLTAAPIREIERCGEIGLLTAPLSLSEGGLGLGSEPSTQASLMRILAAIGGGDLALGRIYEGHVNGILLVNRYGSTQQISRLAKGVRNGMISGVWNTGGPELLKLIQDGRVYRFNGKKTFATGANFVQLPIVTAETAGCGWQMVLVEMPGAGASIDSSFWHPLGMESSESFSVDFTGVRVDEGALIGGPEDFYREPMFRGGAVRFAAVQAGAVMRLHTMFAEWLHKMSRGDDPYQLARLGETAISAQEAAMWLENAATVSEESFYTTDKGHTERMIEFANMMRIAIERLGTLVMRRVTAGVGAHGLLQPARFERVIRDLTMYLRQPAPDATLAAVGRSSLDRAHQQAVKIVDERWSNS